MVLAVIVCLAPAIIGCAMFDATRPIFERATGKIIALILLQTTGLIVLQIVLMGDQWFIAQLTTASINATAGGSALSDEMQVLVALVVWFIAGAFAMYNLPAVAYSIGSGVAISGPPLLLWYISCDRCGGRGGNGGAVRLSSAVRLPPGLSASRWRPWKAPAAHGDAALIPPPPPPSIATSTRR